MDINKIPSRDDANSLLHWASRQNPGPWVEHCKAVARIAETIASKCGLDADRAYVSGLLHDIGYYGYRDGMGSTCHIYLGYKLMMEQGYADIARICLTHSFPVQDIRAYGGSDMNCSDSEIAEIKRFLADTVYDDYDKLTQLCDCLGTAQGVCLMESRMVGVVRRHGFKDLTIPKWDAFFALKKYFDDRCGMNIYGLFRDEIVAGIFE